MSTTNRATGQRYRGVTPFLSLEQVGEDRGNPPEVCPLFLCGPAEDDQASLSVNRPDTSRSLFAATLCAVRSAKRSAGPDTTSEDVTESESAAPTMAVSIAGISTACSKDALVSSAKAVREALSTE